MLTGLEILLARMKTNPEEFLRDDHVPYEGEMFGGKWSDLLDYAWRVADKDERDALEAARKEFYRDDFNERVMKRLAGEETPVVAEKDLGLRASQRKQMMNAQKMNAQQQQMQNPMAQGVIQGGMYDPNTHKLVNALGQAPIKAEGQFASYGADTYLSGGGDKGFFGLGKLFGK